MSELVMTSSVQASPKVKHIKGVPPKSHIKCPGQLFKLDKGEPPFYKYFQTLYSDLENRICQTDTTYDKTLDNEAHELLQIIEKLFQFYGLKVNIIDYKESPHQTLSCLKNLLEIIHSFSKDLLLKLNFGPIYIYANQEQMPLSKTPIHPEDHTFIISSFKSVEEINHKFYTLLLGYISKLSNKPIDKKTTDPLNITINNFYHFKASESKPKSPLRSILKERSSICTSSSNISILVSPKETRSRSPVSSFRKQASERLAPKKNTPRVSFKSM